MAIHICLSRVYLKLDIPQIEIQPARIRSSTQKQKQRAAELSELFRKKSSNRQVSMIRIIYSSGLDESASNSISNEIEELKELGLGITPINHRKELGIVRAWPPNQLEKLYVSTDGNLIDLYDKVISLASTHDVFIVNLENVYHPKFVRSLKNVYTVIVSGDDPDSSDYCSRPFVSAFDHAFAWGVNFDANFKITEKFLEWGAKKADWWPYGVASDTYSPALTAQGIYNGERDVDLVFVGGLYPSKLRRIAKIKKHLPQMKIYGNNWTFMNLIKQRGGIRALSSGLFRVKPLPANELVPLYQRSKIGLNVHLSYGPSNIRTYQLPANGVMQICDCPEGIGDVFEIDKEIIVYHSSAEAIELIDYYLENDQERKKIAAAGFKRVIKDYRRIDTFSHALTLVLEGMQDCGINSLKDGTQIEEAKKILATNVRAG
jgi:spore maturation protein CgeB